MDERSVTQEYLVVSDGYGDLCVLGREVWDSRASLSSILDML